MIPIVFLRSARRDLDGIWAYVAERDVAAADRMIDRLRNATWLLARQPQAGVDAANLKPGLRKWTVGPYKMFYFAGLHQIQVVRIIHGARDLRDWDLF